MFRRKKKEFGDIFGLDKILEEQERNNWNDQPQDDLRVENNPPSSPHIQDLEQFKKVSSRSKRLQLVQLATLMKKEQTELLEWLYELPEDFGFMINGDQIEFIHEIMDDKIDSLLHQFELAEESKRGKI
ncbi:MAG: hypothetical protein INQ03_16185 [Candidatus Heimdallarchaeota archaeon]|nr:hypothetical protein [Candidatus Heimdallarchaeota archaeon]